MIRYATKDDVEIINNFRTKFMIEQLKFDNPSLEIISDCLKLIDENNIILLYFEDNKSIGYLQGCKEKNKGLINQIFVEDNYRDNGIGEELVKEFIKWCDNNSIKNIETNIENGNDAFFLFDKLGFEIKKVSMNLNI